ncbi:hypothetical protein LC653_16375 [Nostoc sp. CHAB 5784]|uniref:hypothetical protein n=1 Tax=Nostoc mirabile TaxID=2907820 RepID=UPI001E448E45|nr:hypothetical protein [Nostoc mirabile]MCC5665452.1 hypothetical protein [Nostoc mirabile CHAB5784]
MSQLSKAQSDNRPIQQAMENITSLKSQIDLKIKERQDQKAGKPDFDIDRPWWRKW